MRKKLPHCISSQLFQNFDLGVDRIRKLSQNFCRPLGITTFAYVRLYHEGNVSWLTSNPDQDQFLIESGAIENDPFFDTHEALKEGMYLWFDNRQFPGCEEFYRVRAERFQMDHGMVVVKYQKNYLETCCFSGLLAKRPLYNLFLNEKGIFNAFMENFTKRLDNRLLNLLEQGVSIAHFKAELGCPSIEYLTDRSTLISECGWKNLLKLSKQEKACLALLGKGMAYQEIGFHLTLSARTVEHYIESVKRKLEIDSRIGLFQAAEKLAELGIE